MCIFIFDFFSLVVFLEKAKFIIQRAKNVYFVFLGLARINTDAHPRPYVPHAPMLILSRQKKATTRHICIILFPQKDF